LRSSLALRDDRDPVDDDLHEELDLEDIEKENEKEKDRSDSNVSMVLSAIIIEHTRS